MYLFALSFVLPVDCQLFPFKDQIPFAIRLHVVYKCNISVNAVAHCM